MMMLFVSVFLFLFVVCVLDGSWRSCYCYAYDSDEPGVWTAEYAGDEGGYWLMSYFFDIHYLSLLSAWWYQTILIYPNQIHHVTSSTE
jgi:hypothetical protein